MPAGAFKAGRRISMKTIFPLLILIVVVTVALCWTLDPVSSRERAHLADGHSVKDLRRAYAGAPETWPAPTIIRPDGDPDFVEMGLLPVRDEPSEALAALGEALFFSPVLSADQDISCATCHAPETGFATRDKQAVGHNGQVGTRNAPGLISIAHSAPYFWDGRAADLIEQATGPMLNPIEMAGERAVIERRMNENPVWQEWFETVQPGEPVRLEDVARAIAAYEATLDETTRFDRFLSGEKGILTDQELEGLHLFRTKAGCMSCHEGPALTDGQFHNIGLTYYGRKYEDVGLYALTGKPADMGRFNTPSLRHVSKTAPYMHNGLFPHLEGIVNIYNAGGVRPRRRESQRDDPLFPKTSPRLEPLELNKRERMALIAFLKTL